MANQRISALPALDSIPEGAYVPVVKDGKVYRAPAKGVGIARGVRYDRVDANGYPGSDAADNRRASPAPAILLCQHDIPVLRHGTHQFAGRHRDSWPLRIPLLQRDYRDPFTDGAEYRLIRLARLHQADRNRTPQRRDRGDIRIFELYVSGKGNIAKGDGAVWK